MTARLSDPAVLGKVGPTFITLGSGRKLPKFHLFLALHLGGWVSVAVVCSIAGKENFGIVASMFNTLVWAFYGFMITLILHRLYRAARHRYRSYVVFTGIAVSASILMAPLWSILYVLTARGMLDVLLRVDPLRAVFSKDAADFADFSLFDLFQWPWYAVILFTWASLYFGVNAVLELESERANVAQALKLADSARLQALQSNLNPHFLFNSLNGIATLVRERDCVAAGSMIDALSTFLRSTLQRLDTPQLRVVEEIDLINQYLRIQQYRFGTRLRAKVDATPETHDALVPTLILQPLVENAVRYGVLPRNDGGALWVEVSRHNADLVIRVEDDGPGFTAGPLSAFGMGLKNSTERLHALYGTAASLEIGCRSDGTGCAAVIRLPFRAIAAEETDERLIGEAYA